MSARWFASGRRLRPKCWKKNSRRFSPPRIWSVEVYPSLFEINDWRVTSPPFSLPLAPLEQPLISYKNDIIAIAPNLRQTRLEVENAIRLWSQPIVPISTPKPKCTAGNANNDQITSVNTKIPAGAKAAGRPAARIPQAVSFEWMRRTDDCQYGKNQNPKNVSDLRQALKVVLEKNKVAEKKQKNNEVPDCLEKDFGLGW